MFKVKRNLDGSISRWNGRFVVKGCSQVPGCDFKETFSPVVKPATIRTILSIAMSKKWLLRQVDVNNAFLNSDLSEEVYMQQPPSYVQHSSDGHPLVCRLMKELYGLRQAPRAWFDKLKAFLRSIGFVRSKSDASLFVRVNGDARMYVLVYVDDIIIAESDSHDIDRFMGQLNAEFSLKDMGDIHYFLGIRISDGSILLCQRKYVFNLLVRCKMIGSKVVHTLMVSSLILSNDIRTRVSDPSEYRSIAGALQYVVLTRLDIVYTVNRICQLMHAPTDDHCAALKQILRYLCGTSEFGILIKPSDR